MKKAFIVQAGSYPPPYGGVSTHIKRLHKMLMNEDYSSYVCNMSSNIFGEKNVLNMKVFSSWIKVFKICPTHFHFHTGSGPVIWIVIYYLLAKINKSKLIITYHSLRDDTHGYSRGYKKMLKTIYSFCSQIIVVNSTIKIKLVNLGANENIIKTIPAFLPPAISANGASSFPKEIIDFAKSHAPLISSYAYTVKTFDSTINTRESVDLYGIGTIIELLSTLKEDFPNVGVVLCITYKNDMNYYLKVLYEIEIAGLSKNILIYDKPINNLFMLWKMSHLYLRLTLSDGDSVALREALWCQTPTIASNVVYRPPGTITYQVGDQDDLFGKVKEVLVNNEYYKELLVLSLNHKETHSLIDIYNE
jgi:glycosyltransferase involved in cell wall biosynthesis